MPKLAANLLAISAILYAGSAWSAPIAPGVVEDLRHGGYVLLMRHASSPTDKPDRAAADPENIGLERQLDQMGRETAIAMGRAFKFMHIPFGQVFSSPTYRARETVKLANLGEAQTVPELGDQGQSMARRQGSGPSAWLKARVAERPAFGRNTVIVTHLPNIAAAFPDAAKGLQDGEMLVFKPDGRGHTELIAKVPIEDWGS